VFVTGASLLVMEWISHSKLYFSCVRFRLVILMPPKAWRLICNYSWNWACWPRRFRDPQPPWKYAQCCQRHFLAYREAFVYSCTWCF
jgi:hypothetical protein